MTTNFEVDVIVEIPLGSMYKYEVDKKNGSLTIDRPLPKPLVYNYGYVPNTLHGDGDPLDVCILGAHSIYPLTRVKVKLIGVFKCSDGGASDDKLLAVVVGENYFDEEMTKYIDDAREYLSTYKKGFVVGGMADVEEAYQILLNDVQAYLNE